MTIRGKVRILHPDMARYAVIDLETTGGRPGSDRIIEIAVVLHDGEKVVERYSSLVHPECRIPGYITDITGIDDSMVADAPRFYEISKKVVELTEDTVFVAHNVNFDYNFLRAEYQSLGYEFELPKLCTVRSSRKIFPGFPSYSLGKLCNQLGITLRDRHRALGDAEATAELLSLLLETDSGLVHKMTGDGTMLLPPEISSKNIREIPEAIGLYFFFDGNGEALYAGKHRNLRKKVIKDLGDIVEGKKKVAPQEITEVTFEETGCYLLAELRLQEVLEELSPKYNKKPGKRRFNIGLISYPDQRGYLQFRIAKKEKGMQFQAEFASMHEAKAALIGRAREFELCRVFTGLDAATGICNCPGACHREEPPETYNERAEAALEGLGFPHRNFILIEKGRSYDEFTAIAIENGVVLGYGFFDKNQSWTNPSELLEGLKPLPQDDRFALILRDYLRKNRPEKMIPYP